MADVSHLVQDAVSSTTSFQQLFDAASSTFTYLLGDYSTKTAIIVDPVLDQVNLPLDVLIPPHSARSIRPKYGKLA